MAGGGFHPFDVDAAHLAYTILGAFTVFFGLFSLAIKERLYLGEAPIATVTGIILGPRVLGLFDPVAWSNGKQGTLDQITLEVTRVVIALGVFSVGVELPKAYMKRHWLSLFFLLGPCMVYGWLVSALLIWALVPDLKYLSALVIAACVTPTDPILAQAVVGGKFAEKHVPAHIRHLLSAESGSNDGAAFPFLYIALYLTLDKSPGHAVGEWFYMTWLYEVALGIAIGIVLGFSARKIMQFSERKKIIDRQSYVAQYISLAMLSIGICTLLGSDDLLAAFACGCAFAWDGFFNKATEDAVFSNVIDLLFNCTAFIYIGAIIPFHDYTIASLTVWRLVCIALLILLLRRLPIILALYRWIPDIKTLHEALFVGWFGPMGVGAVFISILARHHIPHPENDGDTSQVDLLQETIFPIVSFLILSSVITHGLSIPFFVSGRRVHSITYTWSRNPSMAANEPAWTTHATRINHGNEIVVNRDDEDGDLGLQSMRDQELRREKSVQFDDGSNGSQSSGTRADRLEKAEEQGEQGETDAHAAGHHAVRQYREGDDLVVERTDPEGGDPITELHAGHFAGEPHRHPHLPHLHSSHASGEPHTHAHLPQLHISRSRSRDSRRRQSTSSTLDDDHSTNAGSDIEDEDEDGYIRRRPYAYLQQNQNQDSPARTSSANSRSNPTTSPTDKVHSYIPASRLGKKKDDGWRRFLRVGTSGSGSTSSMAEEGRASPETGFLPARTRSIQAPSGPSGLGRSATLDPNEGGIPLTRTLSRVVSFAPDAAGDKDTAPTPGTGNYGSSAPGFKRNPGLSMFRTTSVKEEE